MSHALLALLLGMASPSPEYTVEVSFDGSQLAVGKNGTQDWSDYLGKHVKVAVKNFDPSPTKIKLEGKELDLGKCPTTVTMEEKSYVCAKIGEDLQLGADNALDVEIAGKLGTVRFGSTQPPHEAEASEGDEAPVPRVGVTSPRVTLSALKAYRDILTLVGSETRLSRGWTDKRRKHVIAGIEAQITAHGDATKQEDAASALESAARYVQSRKYRDVAIIVLTNDGRLVGPKLDIDENDTVHVLVLGPVVDVGATCSQAPAFRSRGDISKIVDILNWTKDEAKTPPEKEYELLELENCDGDQGIGMEITRLDDSAEPKAKVETLKLPVGKLYRLSVAAGFVFDFSRPASFDVGATSGDTTARITSSATRTGPDGVLSFQVHPRRVDAVGARTRLSEIASLMIGASVRAPREHVYLGTALEPWPGLGINVGYHFQKEDRLKSGYALGDAVTGDAPVLRDWMKPTGREWFVGFIVSSDLVNFILEKRKNAKEEAGD